MIGQIMSRYKILEVIGEGGMGIVYLVQKVKHDFTNWLESSPKGIDTSTEGSALGLDLPIATTTLKGLNT